VGGQEHPYVMMHYAKNYTGNARFYGFCVDLLERVSREVGFDYILDLVPDRKYGAQDPLTGEWNGMVLQLMKHVGRSATRRSEKSPRKKSTLGTPP
jgi:glutamate receptor, ionotropic, invertebrate